MGLNSEGGLFFVSYLDPKVQICKTDLVFEDLFASPDGSFVCGLSGPYLVFWDLDQNGPVDQGPLETHKFGPQVQKSRQWAISFRLEGHVQEIMPDD